MKKRPLGNTGIEVSEISFGGVEIGMPYGIGVKDAADMLSEPQAVDLLRTAVDSGVNFFDTARLYGQSERIMGNAFAGMRDKVVICTKCTHFAKGDGSLPPENELKKIVESSLDESLALLRTDYVDVYMLHQATAAILDSQTIPEIFAGLKKKGKIRAAGISTYTSEETKAAIDSGVWNVIQLPFNLMDQRQKALFPLAAERGVGLVIRSVLLKGLLSDRGKNLHPELARVEGHIQKYDRLLDGVSYPLSALAVKFVLSFPDVAAALVGIDSVDYLNQALAAADGDYLGRDKLETAEKLAFPDPGFIDLPHWDRMNWLK